MGRNLGLVHITGGVTDSEENPLLLFSQTKITSKCIPSIICQVNVACIPHHRKFCKRDYHRNPQLINMLKTSRCSGPIQCNPYTLDSVDSRSGSRKMVRARGLGTCNYIVFYMWQRRCTHEILTIWLPKQDQHNGKTS